MARPSKYNESLVTAICNALEAGATKTAAAESNGVEYETFRRWMFSKVEFHALVIRAEAKAEMRFTATITKAAQGTKDIPGDWRAAESWLKRRRRAEWGDNTTVSADREIAAALASLFAGDAEDGIGTPPLGIDA